MGWLRKLFPKRHEYEPMAEEQTDERQPQITLSREGIDITDMLERRKYVESCLEQMGESTAEIERLQDEYRLVNAYLHDMEEIEALPAGEKLLLEEHAKAIYMLHGDKKALDERSSHMSESDYRKLERLSDQVEEGITKLTDAESYQEKIRKDMQRLEGEKHACRYRMEEAKICLLNMRGMTIICIIAVVACLVILAILEAVLSLDVKVGYLMTAVVAAAALTMMFLRYKEADKELHMASRSYNKVIALQNKVKIRYINNTNLLDYLYVKYSIDSAAHLKQLWDKYQVEREERLKLEQTESDLDFHSERLVKQLKNYHLFDPFVWIHQPQAILDPKEMVEVRHSMILRRQNLRKQMEYNSENGETAKNEISLLVREYPRYAPEIMDMLSAYEKRFTVDKKNKG